MDEFCGSVFWNSSQHWYLNKPLFTKCFRELILIWMPCLLYWLLLPFEIYYLKRSCDKNIQWNKINLSKSILSVFLLLLCAVDLVVAIVLRDDPASNAHIYPVDIWTPIVKLTTFLLIFLFVQLNRMHGIHTSGSQFLFWMVQVLCSICRIMGSGDPVEKDVFWSKYRYTSFVVYFALIICLFVLNCYADERSSEVNESQTKKILPEYSAGFLSRITYFWFDKLAWQSFRNPLTEKDLWQLPPHHLTKCIMQKYNYYFDKQKQKQQQRQKATICKTAVISIIPPIIKSNAGIFLFGSFMKLLTDLLAFIQPQILRLIIGYVESNGANSDVESQRKYQYQNQYQNQPQWLGISYAILLFMIATMQTIVLCQYFHRMFIVGLRIRSTVINTIYRKALAISNSARKNFTTGEIVNLMAVDAQRFMDLTTYLNMIWSAPLQIGLALYFLWQQLGPSVLAGLTIMIILVPINAAIAGSIKSFQVKQMQYKDERVKLMNEILTGMKVIKLNAWENNFEDQLNLIRDKEISTLKATSYLNATTFLLMFCASFLVSLATFATYILIDESHVLDATKTFVSLSLFNILSFPLNVLPVLMTNIVQAQISVQRINKFINSPELDPKNVQREPNETYSILIENGNFTWHGSNFNNHDENGDGVNDNGNDNDNDNDELLQLSNINMKVKKQTLNAIIGFVGSGKSSLIQGILGEMLRLSGHVNVDGSIAYVPQQAWILNATIRENILFGRPYDHKRYTNIINACALQTDIEMFPAGDTTEIGERGINLSGGQRQRISLARAIYSDADIYLLDDPLSAVDANVGRHIFERVIGSKGLLENKTRVLVTHFITFLPQVDYIYVLKSGQITEHGTYTTLLEKNDAFAVLAQQYKSMSDKIEMKEAPAEAKAKAKAKAEPQAQSESEAESEADSGDVNDDGDADGLLHVTKSECRRTSLARHDAADGAVTNATLTQKTDSMNVIAKNVGKLIEDEHLDVVNVPFGVYSYYIKHIGSFLFVMTLLLILVFQIFQVGSNLWLAKWSNDNRLLDDNSVRDMYLFIYGILGSVQAISSFLAILALSIGCLFCSRQLHSMLLWNVLRWPMALFDITPVGRILNRFSKDIDIVDNALPHNWRMILMQSFALLAAIVVITISTPIFLSTMLPIAVIYVFTQRVYVATSRQLTRLESASRSPIYSHFSETLAGVSSIRAYGVAERFMNISDMRVDHNNSCQYPALIANRWLSVRLEMIGNFIIFFASVFAVLHGQRNAGMVGLSISYALQVTDALKWLVRLSSDIENNIVAVERIKEYSEMEQEAEWYIEPNTIPLPIDWPSAGKILFDNLQLRYRDELDLVLKGISFYIKNGEKVGIVGRTGAGKSSLTLALFRIIEPAGGRILIDDIDIGELGLHQLRSRLTIIPQDPVLFSGSLRSNIDPLKQKSDAEIWRAVELSHLKELVQSLSAGLHHQITEGGGNLSIGQRQLICLARALLHKSKILVLDEATAAVDYDTDNLIQQTIRSEFKECTVLTIAHRLKTILDYDRIVVLDRGTVAEIGTVVELLNNSESIFYAMAKDANII